MAIVASAPGKLVVAGEYAVLDGVPALVMAVNRRVRVELTASDDDCWHVVSPTLNLRGSLEADAAGFRWTDAPLAELEWVRKVLNGYAPAAALAPQRIVLDSTDFYARRAARQDKLGLGSSAALVVALLGALHRCAGAPAPTLAVAIAAHQAIQEGAGSGVGVAAALLGGLLRFQLQAGDATATPCTLPADLVWRCMDAGRSTSTRAMLAAVAAARQRDPTTYARCAADLAQAADSVFAALRGGSGAALMRGMERYAAGLKRLSDWSGAGIVSAEHAALGALAHAAGCIYKSCGAGGGDTGIALATAPQALAVFVESAATAGYSAVDLALDRNGLRVDVATP